jgi:hypothetical protein
MALVVDELMIPLRKKGEVRVGRKTLFHESWPYTNRRQQKQHPPAVLGASKEEATKETTATPKGKRQ